MFAEKMSIQSWEYIYNDDRLVNSKYYVIKTADTL